METNVTALNDVDYTLDLRVPQAELEPRITAALKKQRAGMSLKGFRPGKVPLSYVKKMVGPQVAIQVAEEVIGEAFQSAVSENEEYAVLGQPRLAELNFDPESDDDLHAVIHFGTAPQFELADLDGVPVTKFVRTFTDEDVDEELEARRARAAELEPAEDGATVGDTDVAIIDIQPIDAEGETTGPKQHGAQIMMADPGLRAELKEALLGKTVGDSFALELPHDHADDEGQDHDDHIDRYTVEVTAINRRILPEMDAEFVKSQTNGKHESIDELKGAIREELEQSWERRAQQALEGKMVEQFVEAHDFTVPETLIEASLDSIMDDLRERQGGSFQDGFDAAAHRASQREQAERQIRWMLVKQKLIEANEIEVTQDDFEAEFETMTSDEVSVDMIRSYFMQQPQILEQMGDTLLNRRVFDALGQQFTVVEKTREDLEAERAEK